MQREVGIGAAEAGDKMIFKSVDGALGGVATVNVGWYELVVYLFGGHEALEESGGFVV
jgi:hypothetical protein